MGASKTAVSTVYERCRTCRGAGRSKREIRHSQWQRIAPQPPEGEEMQSSPVKHSGELIVTPTSMVVSTESMAASYTAASASMASGRHSSGPQFAINRFNELNVFKRPPVTARPPGCSPRQHPRTNGQE